MNKEQKQQRRYRRHRRVRAKIKGSVRIPRLCVFKSANHIYAQLINDEKGETLVSASDSELKKTKTLKKKGEKQLSAKIAKAYEVGKLISQKSLEKKIKKVVFDRGGYKYHGRVKALADGVREGGLKL